MYKFTPSEIVDETVPFVEDATTLFAPYHSSGKSIEVAKSEITVYLERLGASLLQFQVGIFEIGKHKRHGVLIHYMLNGAVGVIRVAGLPMRRETPKRTKQVLLQALLNVRDWLKTSVTQSVFSPGVNPLLLTLLVEGNTTVADIVLRGDNLLPAEVDTAKVVDGDYEEI